MVLFDEHDPSGLTPQGIYLYKTLYSYLHTSYTHAALMNIPFAELTALITRVAVGLDTQFIIRKHQGLNDIEPARVEEMTRTTGYTVEDDAAEDDDGIEPEGGVAVEK